MLSDANGLTQLDFSLMVPPGLTAEQFIMGATEWYYSNFTATGTQMAVGSVNVISIILDGKHIHKL